MKILYDYKIFYQQRFGGISSYFYNLANELEKTDNQFLFYSPIHKNFYLNSVLACNNLFLKTICWFKAMFVLFELNSVKPG